MCDVWVSQDKVTKVDVDVLVVVLRSTKKQGIFKELDQATEGALTRIAESQGFSGKAGQSMLCPVWHGLATRHVLVMGIGEDPYDQQEPWQRLAATSLRRAAGCNAASLAFAPIPKDCAWPLAARGLVMGAQLKLYRFQGYKSDEPGKQISSVGLLLPPRSTSAKIEETEALIVQAGILSDAICSARDLVNEPPNALTPIELASRAQLMADEVGLSCTIFDEGALHDRGFGLLLAVAQGSVEPPRLIHLCYRPPGRRKRKRLALVGKGVTFDSGGLSLKSSSNMMNMHADMAGAAAVFGAMKAIAQLQPDIEVHGILAATENMTGAAAYKLNDVLTSLNGKTVEIRNTDAEGRLALADALVYAGQQGATQIIDLATLTGACMVALGRYTAGVLSNREDMAKTLLQAADEAGESCWQLPMLEDLRDGLKSSVADIANLGDRYGGTISAALFLREFVDEQIDWCHMDIAGPAFADKERHQHPKGGTGFAVATLIQYACHHVA